jgi:hypothetical protein
VRETWSAAVVLVVGVAALVQARTLPFGSIAAPGPGFFPLTLSIGLALIGAVLVARAALAGGGPDAVAAGTAPAAGARARLVIVVGAMFAYAAALPWLGFVLTTFALMVVLFRVVESHRWTTAVIESIASAALSHVVFRTWLGVRLPPGPWGF